MDKWQELEALLRRYDRVAVAFSGGVDSALLVRQAAQTLGADNVLALTAVSQLNPARETNMARDIADLCGVRAMQVAIDALAVPEVAANPPDRCYHCKRAIFGKLLQVARAQGFSTLLDGSNASDRGDYRPGKRAAEELGAVSPFDLCGITKAEIRERSHAFGLPNWDGPSAACLASRIPYGTVLTHADLRRVEAAEDALLTLGFSGCRVRLHGNIARLETPEGAMEELTQPAVRQRLLAALEPLGFDFVTLDLRGYRMGSLNAALKAGEHGV
jgi:uncharacterized protein